MFKSILIVIIVVIAALLVFKAFDNNASAQDQDQISQLLENQKLILQKLDVISSKLDVLKMRVRQ